MEMRLMRRSRRALVLFAAVALMAGLMFALLASGGRLPATAHAAVHHAAKHAQHHAVKSSADGDTVQSGDQTTPDAPGAAAETTAASETGAESESSVESEQGQPGEPAVGHADPAGSSGQDCTGNCVQ
jgi:hypothetical protein